MATLITHDGKTKQVKPRNKKEGFHLPQLYKLLGCQMIEKLDIGDNKGCERLLVDLDAEGCTQMIIDEEGKGRDDRNGRYNYVATGIWSETHGTNNFHLLASGDEITGDVLLCSPSEFL